MAHHDGHIIAGDSGHGTGEEEVEEEESPAIALACICHLEGDVCKDACGVQGRRNVGQRHEQDDNA